MVVTEGGRRRPSRTTLNFKVPLVSEDWLIACAIRGETVDAELFKVEFVPPV